MKYRKSISIFITVLLSTAVFTGCNQANVTPTVPPTEAITPSPEPTTEPTPEPAVEETPETEQKEESRNGLMVGLGVYTDLSKSTEAAQDKEGKASATSVIASILTDSAGLILKCDLDSTQTAVPFNGSGQLLMDKTSVMQSKALAGTSYGMAAASAISKEWNEQAKSFSDWCVGKNIGEITGMTVRKSDSGGIYPDIPELAASVTIDIGGFLSSINSAANSLVYTGMQAGPSKTGIGITSTINSKSISASHDANGLLQLDTTVAAVALDETGRILSCRFDAAQPKVPFSQTGTFNAEPTTVLSKQDLKEGYGMMKASAIGKEWYQQADAFADWTVGKTIDELRSFSVSSSDEGVTINDPELTSAVTITVGEFMVALEKAIENAQ